MATHLFSGRIWQLCGFLLLQYVLASEAKELTTKCYGMCPDSHWCITEGNRLQCGPKGDRFGYKNQKFDSVGDIKDIPLESFGDTLKLDNCGIKTLDNAIFPDNVWNLHLHGNELENISKVTFPESLYVLGLTRNNLRTVRYVQLPEGLFELSLSHNPLGNLNGLTLPNGLKRLILVDDELTDLSQTKFPASLQELYLAQNPNLDRSSVTVGQKTRVDFNSV